MGWNDRVAFGELAGKTVTTIHGMNSGSDRVTFECADGSEYVMYHSQDCCESVSLNEVVGNVDDLIGSPITQAEEASNAEGPKPSEWAESVVGQFAVSNHPICSSALVTAYALSLKCTPRYYAGCVLLAVTCESAEAESTNAQPREAVGRCVEQELGSTPCSSAWIEHWIRSQRPGVQLTPRGQYAATISLKEHRASRLGALSISISGAGIMTTRQPYRKCRASQSADRHFPLSSLGNATRFLSVPFSISCSIPRSINRCATADSSEPNRCVRSRSVRYSQTPSVRVTCRPSVPILFGLRPGKGSPFECHYNGIEMDAAQGAAVTNRLPLKQFCDVLAGPDAIRQPSRHCGRRVDAAVSLRKRGQRLHVVVGEKVQGDGVAVVLQFLGETVGESRETARRHAKGQVGALDKASADVLAVGVAEDRLAFGPNAQGRAVPTPAACRRAVLNDAIDFPKTGVVNAVRTERACDCRLIEGSTVRGKLNAASKTGADVAHEVHGAMEVAWGDGPRRHQFGVGVNRNPRPRIAPTLRQLLVGAGVLLLGADEAPDLINLDSLALQVDVARTLEGIARNANVSDKGENRPLRSSANAARSADAIAIYQSADDCRSTFQTQSVHGYKYA